MSDSWDDDEDCVEFNYGEPEEPASSDESEEVTTLLFTAANPSGSVSVSTMISGLVVHVDLSPEVVRMTESQLSEEITVISKMARRQAQAAQHVLAADVMHKLGHDGASTRSYLERELGLPAPETVLGEKLNVLNSRYADEHD